MIGHRTRSSFDGYTPKNLHSIGPSALEQVLHVRIDFTT